MTVYIVISPFTEFFLKQTPLVWGHHLVVAHSLAFSFNIPKIENFTKLLTQLFHTFAFAILPSLETIWQVGIVFRSPAIYLGRSLIIREYNGKFSDRITIQTSSLRTFSRESSAGVKSKENKWMHSLFPTNFAGYHDALVNLPHLQNRSRNTAAVH